MNTMDPEVRERLAIESLRHLLARHYDAVRALIDDDAAFEPSRLTQTRKDLRTEVDVLEEIAAEALGV